MHRLVTWRAAMRVKTLIVFVFCLFMLSLFTTGMISGVDLTPDTPPSFTPVQGDDLAPLRFEGVVNAGSCGPSYTVLSGDTLSSIAQLCGVSLEDLVMANPGLGNPNLISVGQVLRMPAAQAAPVQPLPTQQTNPVEQAAPPSPTEVPPAPTEAPALQSLADPAQDAPPSNIIPGALPGSTLTVEISDLQPFTPVQVTIGPMGGEHTPIGDANADDTGKLRIDAVVPLTARPGELWTVIAITKFEPIQEFSAEPFPIGGPVE